MSKWANGSKCLSLLWALLASRESTEPIHLAALGEFGTKMAWELDRERVPAHAPGTEESGQDEAGWCWWRLYYINLWNMPFNLHRCTALYLLTTSETESNWPCQPGGGKRGRNIPEWIFDSLLPHSLYHNTQKTPVKFVEGKLSLYCYPALAQWERLHSNCLFKG